LTKNQKKTGADPDVGFSAREGSPPPGFKGFRLLGALKEWGGKGGPKPLSDTDNKIKKNLTG